MTREDPDVPSPAASPRNLPGALLRAREAVMERLRPVLRAHDLTEQQWRVLRTLSGVEEIEVTGLARKAFVRPPSLSRILRDLTARGLIARRSADDLRCGLISITPDGLALIQAAAPGAAAVGAEIARLYGAGRLQRLTALLEELEAVLAQQGA